MKSTLQGVTLCLFLWCSASCTQRVPPLPDGNEGGLSKCTPGETIPCYNGSEATKDVGECQSGVYTCDDIGVWSTCTKQTLPTEELCNQKDDDCDGFVDNVKGSQAPLKRQCYPKDKQGCVKKDGKWQCFSFCKTGGQVCQNGTWTSCDSAIAPKYPVELCYDEKDNDCDGKIDEDCCFPDTDSKLFEWTNATPGVPKIEYRHKYVRIDKKLRFIAAVNRLSKQDLHIMTLKGQVIRTLRIPHAIFALSPEGTSIFSSHDQGNIVEYNIKEGKKLRTLISGESGRIQDIVFDERKNIVIAGHEFPASITFWERKTGEVIRRIKGDKSDGKLIDINVCSNNHYVAAIFEQGVLKIWRLTDGKLLKTIRRDTNPTRVVFSPFGKWMAFATKNIDFVEIWDAKNLTLKRNIETKIHCCSGPDPQRIELPNLQFSPNGSWLWLSSYFGESTFIDTTVFQRRGSSEFLYFIHQSDGPATIQWAPNSRDVIIIQKFYAKFFHTCIEKDRRAP